MCKCFPLFLKQKSRRLLLCSYSCLCYSLELCLVGSHHFYEIICIMDTLKTVARDGWFDNKMAVEAADKCSAITICPACSCLILVDTVCHILQFKAIESIHRTLTIYCASVIKEYELEFAKYL